MAEATDLCLLDDAKGFMTPSLNGTTSADYVVDGIIGGVSAFIRDYLSRDLAAATYIETRNGNARNSLRTLRWPIIAVQSLTVNDQGVRAAPDTTSAGYILAHDRKYIYLRGAVPGGRGGLYSSNVFYPGIQNVTVAYTAGYLTPGQSALAALPGWQASHRYAAGDQILFGSYIYGVTQQQPGMSDVIVPAFPTEVGATVADANVIWTCLNAWTPPPLGASPLPAAIAIACMQLVALAYTNRTRTGDTGTGEGQQRVNYMIKEMHPTTAMLLNPYRSLVQIVD